MAETSSSDLTPISLRWATLRRFQFITRLRGGRQFTSVRGLLADVLDFRVYKQALGPDQIALSFALGSDSSLGDAPE